jgi:hypothetical protein
MSARFLGQLYRAGILAACWALYRLDSLGTSSLEPSPPPPPPQSQGNFHRVVSYSGLARGEGRRRWKGGSNKAEGVVGKKRKREVEWGRGRKEKVGRIERLEDGKRMRMKGRGKKN